MCSGSTQAAVCTPTADDCFVRLGEEAAQWRFFFEQAVIGSTRLPWVRYSVGTFIHLHRCYRLRMYVCLANSLLQYAANATTTASSVISSSDQTLVMSKRHRVPLPHPKRKKQQIVGAG